MSEKKKEAAVVGGIQNPFKNDQAVGFYNAMLEQTIRTNRCVRPRNRARRPRADGMDRDRDGIHPPLRRHQTAERGFGPANRYRDVHQREFRRLRQSYRGNPA